MSDRGNTPTAERRLILVTGAPRSGTTAVGRILAYAAGACNLHEPFNRHVGLRGVEHYFQVPGAAGFTRQALAQYVRDIRRLRLRFRRAAFPDERGLRRLFRLAFGGRGLNSYRRCRMMPGVRTIIWKDPFAALCAGKLARDFGVDVVVTVRNPWAVAASFKRMRWAFEVEDLAARLEEGGINCDIPPELWEVDVRDPVVNAAVLWRMLYGTLQREMGCGWPLVSDAGTQTGCMRFLDLESVVSRPVHAYRGLYRDLGLKWSGRVRRRIDATYARGSGRREPRSGKAHDPRRDPRTVNSYWRQFLAAGEADLVTRIDGRLWEDLSLDAGSGETGQRC